MKFSQRVGITPATKAIQIGSMDEELRNSLWSIICIFYWDEFNRTSHGEYISGSKLENIFRVLWLHYFKKPTDTIPEYFHFNNGGLEKLRDYFFKAKWYEVYDFVEFIGANGKKELQKEFISVCNSYFERESSGYRFVDDVIIEISSSDEVSEIEHAIKQSTPYYGVKEHLNNAIKQLGDKQNPDYRNSIKESISAVESLCKTLSDNDDKTLGAALKTLEKQMIVHPALKTAFSSLYGFTNDANGIRHALMEESNLTSADARFMLISCSAFVNYIIASVASFKINQRI